VIEKENRDLYTTTNTTQGESERCMQWLLMATHQRKIKQRIGGDNCLEVVLRVREEEEEEEEEEGTDLGGRRWRLGGLRVLND